MTSPALPILGNTYVPTGTRLVYVADFTLLEIIEQSSGVINALAGVTNGLSNNWGITVERSYPQVTQETIELDLLTQTDYGGQGTDGLDDIRKNCDHEFYLALGELPQGSRITSYTLPGQAQQKTGAPPAVDTSKVVNDAIQKLLDQMKAQFQLPNLSTMVWVGLAGVVALGALFIFLNPVTPR